MSPVTRTRNVYLDLFKYLLCLFVIAIHVAGEDPWFFPVYRLAVPMFFLVSGHFAYTPDPEALKRRSVGQIGRTLRYLFVGFGFYILFDFVMCFVDGHGVGYYFTTLFYEDFLLEFLFLNRPITYTGAQLWFLIALFVVSLVHYLLVRFGKLHWYRVLVPACYLIYFFFAGYMYLLQDTDMPIRYTRNAWFFGLPNFGLGFLLARVDFHKKSWYKYGYLAGGVLCFLLQIGEERLLRTENGALEMYLTGVLAAVLLLQFFLGLRRTDCPFYYRWFGKNGPFYVYILHMAVAVVQGRLWPIPHVVARCGAILLLSFGIYEVCYLLGMGLRRLRPAASF